MRYKLLFLIGFILLFFSYNDVSASSINYNLKIDKDLHCYETIIYSIDAKDIKRDGNYHFLTSIVDDPVYFDSKNELKYNKTKQKVSNGYLVTLKYDYAYLFLSKSRIVDECFADSKLTNVDSYISFSASGFYCAHRADSINVVINTDLNVLNSNATSINGNNYTWNNISNNFNMNFNVRIPYIEDEPMDDIPGDTNTNANNNNSNSNNKKVEKEKKHVNKYVVLGTIGVLVFGTFVVFIALRVKNSKLNKI